MMAPESVERLEDRLRPCLSILTSPGRARGPGVRYRSKVVVVWPRPFIYNVCGAARDSYNVCPTAAMILDSVFVHFASECPQ